ncbi:MAG TPA: hypothetical protein VKB80_00845 [Kofleriaceae bacterium]|nr:hypothetical protein [Kofleriaceae bacterium]
MRVTGTLGMLGGAVLSMCVCACGSGSGGARGDGDGDDGADDGVDAGDGDDGADAGDAGDADGGDRPPWGCVQALSGRYLIRGDEDWAGALLLVASTSQTAILDADSGSPLLGVTGVHDGFTHGCAVLGAAQTAWCWRVNASGNFAGQLGNGTTDASGPLYRATQVLTGPGEPLEGVASISRAEINGSSDARASCAVTTSGGLYCWGDLRWLVNGGVALTSPYAVPITTDGATPLSGVLQVAVYAGHACAVVQGDRSTELRCWGANGSGQLGQGDTTRRQYPTPVAGLDSPSKVVAQSYGGYPTTCAIDDSRVRCWGENRSGQIGANRPDAQIATPILVTTMDGATLEDIQDLHGGNAQFCAFTGDRAVWCWGNQYERYATAYGITNIVALGGTEAGPRYLTSDGVYHIGNTAVQPSCGSLP